MWSHSQLMPNSVSNMIEFITKNCRCKFVGKNCLEICWSPWWCGKGSQVIAQLPLVFMKSGIKINQQCYEDEILQKALMPFAQILSWRNWVYEKYSAPVHRAYLNGLGSVWWEERGIDFLSQLECLSKSSDINPMNFSVWRIVKAKILSYPHHN